MNLAEACPPQLLLVEDDPLLAEAICACVAQQGWRIETAGSAAAARALLQESAWSVLLLDIGLPDQSGLSLLRWLRSRYDATPVLMITARAQLSDRIRGLDEGADDYLVKPFDLDELLARVRALVRRSKGALTPELACGEVVLDPRARTVTRGGHEVLLSVHEYRTLLALMERPGSVLTRDALERAVYGNDLHVESNTIAVFVHQLRRKLGEAIVATVHGHGYRLGAVR